MTTTITDTTILKEKALKVKLLRKKINRNTTDKGLSDLLADMKKVKMAGGVRVNKSIFPKEATDKYMKVISEAGKYFYRVTTPWDDRNFRLLSIEIYKDFTKRMKEFTRDFREAVMGFIDTVELSIEKMKVELGDAFSMDDYKHLFTNGQVDRDKLLAEFTLEVEYDQISSTDTDDLRASLTEADRAIISAHIEEQQMKKFAKSQEHLVVSLYDCIEAIHERLRDTDNIFRDTLIGNLEDLCDLIPKMNIGGDKDLNDLAVKAKAELCSFGPQELRDDTVKRAAVDKAAEKLLGNMQGMM